MKTNFLELTYKNYVRGEQEKFKNTLEDTYYPTWSLKRLTFNFESYDQLLEKQRLLKAELDSKKQLADEYGILIAKCQASKLDEHERIRYVELAQDIGSTVNKLDSVTYDTEIFNENYKNQTPLGLHTDNMVQYELNTINMTDPINSTMSFFNLLIGEVAIYLAEHL